MRGYEYRRLEVGWEDLSPTPAARCRIHDSALGDPIVLERHEDEPPPAFERRKRDFVTDYLNALGRERWRVLYYAPAILRTPATGVALIGGWPDGTHWLARGLVDGPPDPPAPADREGRRRLLAVRLRALRAALAERRGARERD